MTAKEKLVHSLENIVFSDEIVPVRQFFFQGKKKTYITYALLSEPTEVSADDEEQETVIHFTISLYTSNPAFDCLVKEIRNRLKKAGFTITSRGPETYEPDAEVFHIVTDCSIENLEEV